ncbi:hypothetical protein PM082_023720 [Marasmius tenuissimus]|nr:hypothetical protein PM082_023720 [Marasmius tenuissimus]
MPHSNGQPSFNGSELRFVHAGRDYNLNEGSGAFIVNNDNRVIRQKRPIRWHIRGTEEEEAEYDQYGEYRRSDIRLIQLLQHENLERMDRETGQFVPLDCERSIFLAEVLTGVGKGMLVTVVSYEGQDAPEKWKNTFQHYSGHLYASNAHLLGLNRSKVPLLILLGELVPATVFIQKMGNLQRLYISSLHWRRPWNCGAEELWLDGRRGVICRGPEGPHTGLPRWTFEIEDPISSVDILKEDVLMRYLASFKSKAVDRRFVELEGFSRIDWPDPSDVLGRVDRPTVFCNITDAPIAVANNFWESDEASLVERKSLEDGWTRFRLCEDNRGSLDMFWNINAGGSWLSQASSIFHARGTLLEEDLSTFMLVEPCATLEGELSDFEDQHEFRLQQPIYIFVREPPSHHLHDGDTSSLHYWSFQESGHNYLSPEVCHYLGLPVKLKLGFRHSSHTWSTDNYKSIHQYQVLRGFDPTTTNFAQQVGFVDQVFHPVDDSYRFTVVQEEPHTNPVLSHDHDPNIDVAGHQEHSTTEQRADPSVSTSRCTDDVDVAFANPERGTTSDPLRILQRAGSSEEEIDSCVVQDLHDSDEIEIIQEPPRKQRDSLVHIPSHFSTARPLVTPEWDLGTRDSEIASFHNPSISTLNNRDSPYADPDIYSIKTTAMSDGCRPQTVTSLTMTPDDLSTTGLTPHPGEDISYVDGDVDNHRLLERKHEDAYLESTNEKKEELITPTEPAQTILDGTHESGTDTTGDVQQRSLAATWWLTVDYGIFVWCLYFLFVRRI